MAVSPSTRVYVAVFHGLEGVLGTPSQIEPVWRFFGNRHG